MIKNFPERIIKTKRKKVAEKKHFREDARTCDSRLKSLRVVQTPMRRAGMGVGTVLRTSRGAKRYLVHK